MEIEHFPILQDGDIRDYHEMLWQESESRGGGNVKHLCGILACLQFPVHRNDLFSFQKVVGRPDFEESFQMIKHLLREWDGIVEIFHNSFREFVLSKLDDDWVQTIYRDIADHLKTLEGEDLWFSYVFEYTYKAKDYDYVIGKVNREFVDNAMSHYCPNQDVENAIYWAIESAKEKSDLLALSCLGALKSRTQDRMENLDRSLLSEVLLTMGKAKDIFHYSYSPHSNQWLVDHSTALDLLEELSNQHRELGEGLFSIFKESFPDLKLSRSDIIRYAHCLGIYNEPSDNILEWLSEIEYEPDTLVPSQPFTPAYAPHLEAYIDAVVKYRPDEYWREIKKTKASFSNELIRYFLIRSIALHKDKGILKQEIGEYVGLFCPKSNPELAFYASFAGLSSETIIGLLGDVSLPPLYVKDPLFHSDPSLNNYRMIFFTLGYTGQKELIEKIRNHLSPNKSWWISYLLFLLQAGECVGRHWAQEQSDWFDLALNSIDILIQIRRGEGERVIELVDLCRYELKESLYWLTRAVEERYPDRLKEWFEKLECLQDSKMWTTHYGINESIEDYTFELQIYERLSSIPKCRKHITKLLEICEKKFKEHLYLKGSSRSDHFLMLASIAARCNFKNKAEEWLRHGIKSTLIYGSHKDVTLFQLIDILEMLNKHEPDAALERCADILEMVDWMPQLTDSRETRDLPQYIFERVAKVNINAALRLLRTYAKNKARWQMQNCLEIFIKQVQNADPEILWALTSLFANHFTEDGNHAKQVVNAKQHIIGMIEKSGETQLLEEFKQRLDQFIRTNITPRHWSKIASDYWQPDSFIQHRDNSQSSRGKSSRFGQETYKLEGRDVTLSKIEERLYGSFEEYKETLEELEKENNGFHEFELKNSALKYHIAQASNPKDLLEIRDYLAVKSTWLNSDHYRELGHQFIELGDVKNGLECLEVAYTYTRDWLRWDKVQNDFKVIADYDKKRAIQLLLNVSYSSMIEYSGFDIPSLIASAYDVLEDDKSLKKVYQDYLEHCQELFEHLPQKEEYEWLKDYSPETDNFNQLAIHFLVDELGTPEIDLGNRLIDICRDLCLSRPEITLSIFIERLSDADRLTRKRLLTILYAVAFENPELLIPYAEKISQFLESNHFQWKVMTIRLLEILVQNGSIPEDIEKELKLIQLCYSSMDKYSIFVPIYESPSKEFVEIFRRGVMKSMQEQIGSCCEILLIDKDTILAKVERVLKQEGWNEEEEKERLKHEWLGYVHPQGYPGILIMTTFSERIFNLFNEILDEIIEKYMFTDDQIEGLWRILQPADPEYKLSKIKPRPKDIEPLSVSDKDAWLSELDNRQVEITHRSITEEWIILLEERVLSQDKRYEVPYRSTMHIHSTLLKKGLPLTLRELEEGRSCILGLQEFDNNESTTLNRARVLLTLSQGVIPDQRLPFLPILTWKINPPLFFGYRNVVSLPNFLIDQYGLTFRDFDLYKGDKRVVKYETWQEGYEDEGYSRELLSYGTRLLIHSSLLEQIFLDHDVKLCQCVFEKRLYYKSKYEGQATEENCVNSLVIMD